MRISRVGLCLFALSSMVGAGPPVKRFEARETLMGSEFKVVLYTADEALASRASAAAFARVAALNGVLSDYDPDSELMRLCDRAGGPSVPVSADLFRILDRSRLISERSQGAFDPTINPVGRLWRRARRDGKLPDPDAIVNARALIGWRDVRLDPAASTVQLRRPGMKLDLGGIAKGFAADEAMEVLARHGIDAALVAAAGDIIVRGAPPETDGWRIAVRPLANPDGPATHALLLRDAAVSTSGDTERFVVIDGKRYSHIVDPATGLGVIDRAGVTVIARDGATADALATASYVLGPDRAIPLVEGFAGAAILYVRLGGDGRETARKSARWDELTRGRAEKGAKGGPNAATAGCKGAVGDYNGPDCR